MSLLESLYLLILMLYKGYFQRISPIGEYDYFFHSYILNFILSFSFVTLARNGRAVNHTASAFSFIASDFGIFK